MGTDFSIGEAIEIIYCVKATIEFIGMCQLLSLEAYMFRWDVRNGEQHLVYVSAEI
jgi:hypothetical protein